ncbi:Drug resistance protein [Apiospora phragmitis]|uniref:Drug resistance protein n=1 Tax=Apiospora phragmitis TaxID=2905665 RepID=A0ABR1VH25_9PEZI
MIKQKKYEPALSGAPDVEKAEPQENGSFREGDSPAGDTTDDTRSTLPLSKGKSIALVATVTGAAFLNTLSIQAVVIILPTLGVELGIPDSRLQWIVSAYSLTFGCFLLLWGRIADLYGKRIIFILGSAFVAATLIANPFLPNEIAFDIFRGLQGLGAAANVPTAIGILGVTFPPGKAKNYAFSAYASGAPLGSIFGNLLGGIIASYANWKWVFGALAGISCLVAVAGVFFIPPPPPNSSLQKQNASLWTSVDWLGGFLITAGLLALLFALTEGNVVGWHTIWIYMLMVISGLLIAIFAAWQCLAILIMGIFFAVFNDWIVYATYFFQDYQGLSPLQTTLRFIPTGVCGVLVAFIVSRLISRVPTYILLMIGNLSVGLSCLLFAIPIPSDTSYFAFGFPAMILGVVGADTTWPCLTLFTSASLPQEDQALGGALINASGQLGRSIGLAITTAAQTAIMARERGVPVEQSGKVLPWDPPSLAGLRDANWLNFALAMFCTVLVGLTFRGTGIVGKIEKPIEGRGEEATTSGDDVRR